MPTSKPSTSVNAMVCDIDTGTCSVLPPSGEVSSVAAAGAPSVGDKLVAARAAKVQVTYVTDPICSACWASEPAWRSVVSRYGDLLRVEHLYGGLLPHWDGFRDAGAGIAAPADVAGHWDEIAALSGQPIDSSVWRRDPLASSYPPSIAAVAVRLVRPQLEGDFLRRVRELLFLEAVNITSATVLAGAAAAVGVDADAYEQEIASGRAEQGFVADRRRIAGLGVRGFPTIILQGREGAVRIAGGFTPDRLEQALLAVSGAERRPPLDLDQAMRRLGRATNAELAAALGLSPAAAAVLATHAGIGHRVVSGERVWDGS